MKSEVQDNRHFIECSCHDDTHVFVFDFEKDYVRIGFFYKVIPFLQRLKLSIQYLFKKEGFYSTEITITNEHLNQLDLLLKEMKKYVPKQNS